MQPQRKEIHINSRNEALPIIQGLVSIFAEGKTLPTAVALLALWAQGASAACASSAQRILPSALAAQPLPLLQESAPDSTPDSEPRSGEKRPAITGLWNTVYVSGGAVVNVGFNIWHSDGTEWALDSISPPFQGNTCAGAWEQIGPRTYRTVHPAFNYDATGMNVVGIFIERVEVTLSADGSTFGGPFTFKNYDFQGNLLPGTVAGRVTATRIKVDAPFPFPIPLK